MHLKDVEFTQNGKRWSQVMYMYYLIGYRMKNCEQMVPGEFVADPKSNEIKQSLIQITEGKWFKIIFNLTCTDAFKKYILELKLSYKDKMGLDNYCTRIMETRSFVGVHQRLVSLGLTFATNESTGFHYIDQ